ncbi:hypothetical protein O181_102799 [Austropuccinia psidii MF-1]|uniref:Integrase zinc-binding domain-containing protein n=1 Tax=Austropuccinia psidii MF-1 TaxID=1389203 RepID=A0A9Q3JJ79_9BASI|nr:hypothetical protein [Austropuccinia psidii MF-1]
MKTEVFSYLVDQIQKAVLQDKDYKEILKQLERGESASDHSLEPQAKLLLIKDRVVIPSNHERQLDILQKHHDSLFDGHPGQEKTLNLIKRDSSWAGMNQIIKDYVSSSDWQPCISTQVASTMEVSSPCLSCVLVETSESINYPKSTSIATTTIYSGRARRMGSGSGSGLKTQERYIMVPCGVESIQLIPRKKNLGTSSPDLVKDFHTLYPDKPGPNTSRV